MREGNNHPRGFFYNHLWRNLTFNFNDNMTNLKYLESHKTKSYDFFSKVLSVIETYQLWKSTVKILTSWNFTRGGSQMNGVIHVIGQWLWSHLSLSGVDSLHAAGTWPSSHHKVSRSSAECRGVDELAGLTSTGLCEGQGLYERSWAEVPQL